MRILKCISLALVFNVIYGIDCPICESNLTKSQTQSTELKVPYSCKNEHSFLLSENELANFEQNQTDNILYYSPKTVMENKIDVRKVETLCNKKKRPYIFTSVVSVGLFLTVVLRG